MRWHTRPLVAPTFPLLCWAFLLLCCTLAAHTAGAFELVPIEATFRPFGADSVQTFRLENASDSPVAIEISIARRTIDVDGADQLLPDEESFVVVPSQVVLRPKQVQAVRVQWVGSPQLDAEAAFRLIAEQVPIDFGDLEDATERPDQERGSHLRMLLRYVASLYVTPRGAQPDLAVEEVVRLGSGDGGERLSILLTNHGTAHRILRQPRLVLRDASGQSVEVADKAMGASNLLAGGSRRFLIAAPPDLGEGDLEARLVLP